MCDEGTMKRLGAILRDACNSFTSALDCFWPMKANGNHDVTEQNLITHLAIAFARDEFHPYAEVPSIRVDKPDERVDLLAIDLDSHIAVAVEVKRGTNRLSESAKELLADWNKLKGVRFAMDYNPKFPKELTCCRMIAATNWFPKVQRWWRNPGTEPAPTDGTGWSDLRNELSKSDRCWVLPIDIKPDWQKDGYKMHVLAAARTFRSSPGWFGAV
ncbi:MAG: hypothetical protein KAY37_05790 [Phycisphaerae bacterium]|nr:hypothetical protein [Phycisphaerae bacterium]